jgi:hypothetical protein
MVRAAAVDGVLAALSPADVVVLLDIAERAGSRGWSCESAAAIAERWGWHYRTVRRSVARIAATGIVVVEHRRGTSPRYHFPPLSYPQPAPMSAGFQPSTPTRPRADEREPRADERVTPRRSARRTYEPDEPPARHVGCTTCGARWVASDGECGSCGEGTSTDAVAL